MEPQTLFNAVISLLGVAGGWIMKAIYESINDLRRADDDLHERINETHQNYVRRDDFRDFVERIDTKLDRIEAKLDSKADKQDCERIHA